VGYQVIEIVDEIVPETQDCQKANRADLEMNCAQPARLPSSPLGYRVVQVAEEKGPGRPRTPAVEVHPLEEPGSRPLQRLLLWAPIAAGAFCLAAFLVGWAILSGQASTPTKAVSTGAQAEAEAAVPAAPPGENFGTTLHFARNPTEAARKARKERKLTFLLHVSGNFEDCRFT
jgi:hypothetical protein